MGFGWFHMPQSHVNLGAPVCLQGGEQLGWGERVPFSLLLLFAVLTQKTPF